MAESIAFEFSRIDPAGEDYYYSNALNFRQEIDSKNSVWKESLVGLRNKNIIALHDAWNYFADHFGLNIIASFEPYAGREPSPQYLINLQHEVLENDVKVIFTEPQLSHGSIISFATDLDLNIAILDPLGGVEGRNSYIDLINYNVNSVADALK